MGGKNRKNMGKCRKIVANVGKCRKMARKCREYAGNVME